MNKNIIFSVIILTLIAMGGVYWFYENKSVEEALSEQVNEQTDTTNQAPGVVTSGENPTPGSSVHDLPVEPAAAVARKDLTAKLSIDEKSIVIMKISDEIWSDGCLGLGKADEMCTMALVPGFRVEMLAKGKTYIYRTDKVGQSLRLETK